MSIIELKEKNCKNCHHCVRSCPTKSICFSKGIPEIIEDECILCGNCYVVCPHDAKRVRSDAHKVNDWLKEQIPVHITLAPSFVALLKSKEMLENHLLSMGFSSVTETAKGAAQVSNEYQRLCQLGSMENIITTCCPVIVSLIKTRYPQLVSQLAPVKSPSRVAAQLIKEKYPQDKVVFLGPCIAKIEESAKTSEVDAVLTFEDLDLLQTSADPVDQYFKDTFVNDIARSYPMTSGILSTMMSHTGKYQTMAVDGIDSVMDCCEAIINHQIENVFIEMSACVGSCLNGPLLQHNKSAKWKAQQILVTHQKDKHFFHFKSLRHIEDTYHPTPLMIQSHHPSEIKRILLSLGKDEEAKELNCGACGYHTCKEKAIAVLEHKADPHLCLPFALEQAQSISNQIIEYTPNGIIVLDESKHIVEINPAAKRYLKCSNYPVKSWPIDALLPSEEMNEALSDLQEVRYFIKEYADYEKTFDHACIPIGQKKFILIILMDLTEKFNKEKMIKQYRASVMEVTQKVIDEQMQTVQEIASLLGETTAKSKIALLKLKKSVEDELL